ncbi:MAG: hypothetical protein IKF83_01220 [Clostridia bacterium]|nr:hypothetical protein [Clostridia bacterium]
MKSQKGVTLTSLIIYIIAMVIVVGTTATLTNYFYGNIDKLSERTQASKEYTSFNSYFTGEINKKGNQVLKDESNESKIIFTSGNQYTYLEGKIYFNKILICRDVSSCRFIYNESTNEVTASITISGKNYTNTYKLV